MTIRDTSVCYFDSTMSGAPTLNGVVGALIGVLDACLLNGFGSVTADSLTVTDGVATLTVSAGHGLVNLGASASVDIGVVILVAGVTGTRIGLNTRWRATITSSTVLTWECGEDIPDGTAEGTITAKRAPTTGWEKPFSDTNLAAYRSIDAAATGLYLRVEDAASNGTEGARVARVVGYEQMSDVSTGTNPFPTETQQAGGLRWVKSATADSTARFWAIIADARTIYLWIATGHASVGGKLWIHFGDITQFADVDAYSCVISGSAIAYIGTYYNIVHSTRTSPATGKFYAARGYAGAVLPASQQHLLPYGGDSYIGQGVLANPCPVDGRVWVAPMFCGDSAVLPRGRERGLYELLVPYASRTWLTPYPDVAGAPMTLVLMASGSGTSSWTGDVIVDFVGPW